MGDFELMRLTQKKEPTTVVGDGRAATVTTSPKPPPPKAPMATYARGPIRRSQHLLGGKDSKGAPMGEDSERSSGGVDARGKSKRGIPKERTKEGAQKVKILKERMPKGEDCEGKERKGNDAKGGKRLEPVEEKTDIARGNYSRRQQEGGAGGQRVAETNMSIRSTGSEGMNGYIAMECGAKPDVR